MLIPYLLIVVFIVFAALMLYGIETDARRYAREIVRELDRDIERARNAIVTPTEPGESGAGSRPGRG